MITMQQLVEDEAAFDAYLATLEHEPEDLDEMDVYELSHRDLLLGEVIADGLRLTNRGTLRGIRLA